MLDNKELVNRPRAAALLRRVASAACAFALACGMMPAGALAQGEGAVQTGTVSCGGGWVLDYEFSDGTATITGVDASSTGTGTLRVPATIAAQGNAPVSAIGSEAFKEEGRLAGIELPPGLRFIGKGAFRESALASIEIPASVEYIPYQCFFRCDKLERVTFADGCTPEYLGTQAFMKCTALTQIVIPPLVGNDYPWITEVVTTSASGQSAWRIGFQCFSQCSKLSKMVLLAGNPTGSKSYMRDGGVQYADCAKDMNVVNYCKGATSRYASTAKFFFSVNFYQSRADAEADTMRTHPYKQAVYESGTNLLGILTGTTEAKAYAGSDAVPALPQAARDAGMVWGVSDYAMESAASTLSDSVDVYPVDKGDMAYAWVSSPEIRTAAGYDTFTTVVNDNGAYVRLTNKGVADLSGMAVFAADGSVVDPSLYTLSYEKATRVRARGTSFTTDEWGAGMDAASVKSAGNYRVRATGVGAYAQTKTSYVEFTVRKYASNVISYSGAGVSASAGEAAFAALSAMDTKPKFVVVAPAAQWCNNLVGAGLAGAGGGMCVPVEGEATADAAFSAVQAAQTDHVTFLGTDAQVGSSVIARIKGNLRDGRFNYFRDAGAEALSLDVYKTVKKYGKKLGYAWGTTAIVASSTKCFKSAAVAQYAYQEKAPVFFTNSKGALSSATTKALKAGKFKKVIIAGPASYVSKSVASAVKKATKRTPQRVLASGATAYAASVASAKTVLSTYKVADGSAVYKKTRVVVASGLGAAYVTTAAQLAAVKGCLLYVCTSSEDMKALQTRLVAAGGDMLDVVYMVGDFSTFDAKAQARVESAWGKPLSTKVAKGDTVERGGVVYKLTSAKKATLVKVADAGLTNLKASTFKLGKKTCTVTAIVANAAAGTPLAAVSVGSKVTKIGAGAFGGCASLAKVTVDSKKLKSVGKGAFAGTSAKLAVKAPAKKLKAYKKLLSKAGTSKKASYKAR